MGIPRRGRISLAALALCILALVIFRTAWLTWLGQYLVAEQEPIHAEMIVVLGGDLRGTRILKGAELAWQGFAPAVLVSGSGELYGRHESDLAVDWAMAHGYPESLFIKFKYPAVSTRDEVHAVTRELGRRRVHSFVLVTSTFHTRRAGMICRQEAPGMVFRIVSSPDRYFTPDGWWKNREGEKTLALEWSKTLTGWFGV